MSLSCAVYIPMAALGLGWAVWRDGWPPAASAVVRLSPWGLHASSALAGVTVALLTVLATRRWVRTTRWARDLHMSFREILGHIGRPATVVLALASGIGEEGFFRMGMQPTLGWVVTSLVFGAVHTGPSRRFLPWTIWATVMGFLLGGIYALTGSIVGPVLAHVLVNYINLRFIVEHAPPGVETLPEPPRLVTRSERR